jgi:ankyrin repeat protein
MDSFEQTPLYDACSRRHYGITKQLLEKGADTETKVSGNILHYASEHGDEDLVRTLLARGVDVHAPECAPRSFEHRTPLHHAAENGHINIIELLGLHGVNTDAKDLWGQTAMYLAVEANNAAAVEALIAVGADTCEKFASGQTILHAAIDFGCCKDIVRLLMTKGIDIEGKDRVGRTALHFAACAQDEEACAVTQFLLDQGASIDAKDSRGRTPLSFAAGNFYYRMVELLVGRGADVTSRDCNGRTPLHFARKGNGRVRQTVPRYDNRRITMDDFREREVDREKVIEFLKAQGATI